MAGEYRDNGVWIMDGNVYYNALEGTKRANVGFQIGGVDVSTLYEPVASGSAGVNVSGFQSGGTDLTSLFAVTGSTGPAITWPTGSLSQYSAGPHSQSARADWYSDGSCSGVGSENNNINSLNWLDDVTAGNGDDFQIKCTYTGATPSSINITSTYQDMNIRRWIVHNSTSGGQIRNTIAQVTIQKKSGGTEYTRQVVVETETF